MSNKSETQKQPFLPFFVGDFLAATVEWPGEAQSLYLSLLCLQWSIGSLPSDVSKLAQTVRWQRRTFTKFWPIVSTKFVEIDQRLVNKRLELHRDKVTELSKKNSKNGRKGAESRWEEHGDRHKSANGESMATAIKSPSNRQSRKPDFTNGIPIQSNPSIDGSSLNSDVLPGAEVDPALEAWRTLIANEGATTDTRILAAVQSVGGWYRIRMRKTFESPKLERDFCDAYRKASA